MLNQVLVAIRPYCLGFWLHNGNGTYTFENGRDPVVAYASVWSKVTNNGDGAFTVNYPDGSSTTINTGWNTVTDNGDSTLLVSYPAKAVSLN